MISRLNAFSPWQTGLARRAPRWLLQPWSERSACPPNDEENIHWLDTSDDYGFTLNYVIMDHTLKSKEQIKDSEIFSNSTNWKKMTCIPCGNLQPSFDWFGNQLLSMNKLLSIRVAKSIMIFEINYNIQSQTCFQTISFMLFPLSWLNSSTVDRSS